MKNKLLNDLFKQVLCYIVVYSKVLYLVDLEKFQKVRQGVDDHTP